MVRPMATNDKNITKHSNSIFLKNSREKKLTHTNHIRDRELVRDQDENRDKDRYRVLNSNQDPG